MSVSDTPVPVADDDPVRTLFPWAIFANGLIIGGLLISTVMRRQH